MLKSKSPCDRMAETGFKSWFFSSQWDGKVHRLKGLIDLGSNYRSTTAELSDVKKFI